MKRNRLLALIAVLFTTHGWNTAGEATAGSLTPTAAATIAAPLEERIGFSGKQGGSIWHVQCGKKRRFFNPGVFLDGGLDYLDPYDGYPPPDPCDRARPHDPAQRTSHRLGCREVRELLRRRGYRRIRAQDCKGKIYGFDAYLGRKRFKLRVRSSSGAIASRTRI
ncbi:MAG: hypothetical protein ACR2PM_02790 [Hyphomicrobiales bacterium]